MTAQDGTRIQFRTCPLCEATCGLEITIRNGAVQRIRGDREDVFSHGFICPKGSTLKQLETDPDRLRAPQIRTDDGWRDATWDEAFTLIGERLAPIIDEHGANAVGVYLGIPIIQNLSGILSTRSFSAPCAPRTSSRRRQSTRCPSTSPAVSCSAIPTNILSDENDLDPLSGNATLNAIPVTVSAAG